MTTISTARTPLDNCDILTRSEKPASERDSYTNCDGVLIHLTRGNTIPTSNPQVLKRSRSNQRCRTSALTTACFRRLFAMAITIIAMMLPVLVYVLYANTTSELMQPQLPPPSEDFKVHGPLKTTNLGPVEDALFDLVDIKMEHISGP
jgi:hypothetical protein